MEKFKITTSTSKKTKIIYIFNDKELLYQLAEALYTSNVFFFSICNNGYNSLAFYHDLKLDDKKNINLIIFNDGYIRNMIEIVEGSKYVGYITEHFRKLWSFIKWSEHKKLHDFIKNFPVSHWRATIKHPTDSVIFLTKEAYLNCEISGNVILLNPNELK